LNETQGEHDEACLLSCRHQFEAQQGEPDAAGKRGAVMSVLMDLLFREYLKAKLAEMKALPAVPADK
jgi:hypothetical protein